MLKMPSRVRILSRAKFVTMTLSLNIIKKSEFINLSEFIQRYINILECEYTDENLQGFVYSKEGGVIGIAFEGPIKPIKDVGGKLITEEATIASRKISTLKIWHQNNKESREEVIRTISDLKNIKTNFILLNHNIRNSTKIPLSERFPKITEKGNIYSPVGTITKYFEGDKGSKKEYINDHRGIDYATQSRLVGSAKIADAYFQDFIDSGNFKQLVNPKITGLKHYTSAVYEEESKLKICFMQNIESGYNIARYTFKPDTVFCSDERLFNSFVRAYYRDTEIEVGDKLKFYTQEI